MKLVISGGWGYGNIGDEAIAAATIHLVNRYFGEVERIYTAYDTENFMLNHNVDSIPSVHSLIDKKEIELSDLPDMLAHSDNYGLSLFKNLFDKSTVFIMSGGGYFHEKWKSQFLARLYEIEMAKQKGAKVVVIGQSIGPVFSDEAKKSLTEALSKVDYLSVRDESSYSLISNLGLATKCHRSPDLALVIADTYDVEQKKDGNYTISLMPASYTSYVSNSDRKPHNALLEKIKKRVSITSIKYEFALKKMITRLLKEENVRVNIVLSTVWGWDRDFADKIVSNTKGNRAEIIECRTYKELCSALASGDVTVSTKMHPLIISASFGKPLIGISYNYKVDDFMTLIGMHDQCLRIDAVSANDLLNLLKNEKDNPHVPDVSAMKEKVYNSFCEVLSLTRNYE